MQAVSTICLYLTGDVVIHVLNETFLMMIWTKLEELYTAKSLTNIFSFEIVLSNVDERRIEHA